MITEVTARDILNVYIIHDHCQRDSLYQSINPENHIKRLKFIYKLIRSKNVTKLSEIENSLSIKLTDVLSASFLDRLDEIEDYFLSVPGSSVFKRYTLPILRLIQKLSPGKFASLRQDLYDLTGIRELNATVFQENESVFRDISESDVENEENMGENSLPNRDMLLQSFDSILNESNFGQNETTSTIAWKLEDGSTLEGSTTRNSGSQHSRSKNYSIIPESEEAYLKTQETYLKYSTEKVDPELQSKLQEITSKRANYTLHLYHVFKTKNEALAINALNEFYNSLQQERKNQEKLSAPEAEEELTDNDLVELLRTRPYRTYSIALAQMYFNLGNMKLARFACKEALNLSEGFSDSYNKNIYLAAQYLYQKSKPEEEEDLYQMKNFGEQFGLVKQCPNTSVNLQLTSLLNQTINNDDSLPFLSARRTLTILNKISNFANTWDVSAGFESKREILFAKCQLYTCWGFPSIAKVYAGYLLNDKPDYTDTVASYCRKVVLQDPKFQPTEFFSDKLKSLFQQENYSEMNRLAVLSNNRLAWFLSEMNIMKNNKSVNLENIARTWQLCLEWGFEKLKAHFQIYKVYLRLSTYNKTNRVMAVEKQMACANMYFQAAGVLEGDKHQLNVFCYFLSWSIYKSLVDRLSRSKDEGLVRQKMDVCVRVLNENKNGSLVSGSQWIDLVFRKF